MRCQMQESAGWSDRVKADRLRPNVHRRDARGPSRGEGNVLGMLADHKGLSGSANSSGIDNRPDGTFSNVPRPDVQLAEVQRTRCLPDQPLLCG